MQSGLQRFFKLKAWWKITDEDQKYPYFYILQHMLNQGGIFDIRPFMKLMEAFAVKLKPHQDVVEELFSHLASNLDLVDLLLRSILESLTTVTFNLPKDHGKNADFFTDLEKRMGVVFGCKLEIDERKQTAILSCPVLRFAILSRYFLDDNDLKIEDVQVSLPHDIMLVLKVRGDAKSKIDRLRKLTYFKSDTFTNLPESIVYIPKCLTRDELEEIVPFPLFNSELCAICQESIEVNLDIYPVILPICNHTFHEHCIKKWLRTGNTCPLCKANVGDNLRIVGKQLIDRLKSEILSIPKKYPCKICMAAMKIGDDIISLPCPRSFHASCISKWLQTNKECPSCQHDVVKGIKIAQRNAFIKV